MLREGATLDRYQIEAEIGSGGMGRVFRAFDTRLHRRVALKVLLAPGLDGDERAEAVARLVREARAAASLNHPNVVGVFDAGESAGTPYIAMEYISGISLMRYVGDRSVPWAERLRWLADVARALGAAHRAGLVHRDVKPANVIVRDDGVVKVLDFGIAHMSAPELGRLLQTTGDGLLASVDATILGTPLYMSPEQLRGDAIDGRADQFAWGVLAYELLAGRSPWLASGAHTVIGMILSKDPRHLGEIAPELPDEVADIVMQALRKDVRERFAEMEEIAEALQPWVAPAPAPISIPPLGKPVSSRRPGSGSMAAVYDGGASSRPSFVPHPPASERASEQQPSSVPGSRLSDGGVTPPAVGLTGSSRSISVLPPSSARRRITPPGGINDEGAASARAARSGGPLANRRRWPVIAGLLFAILGVVVAVALGGQELEAPRVAALSVAPAPTTLIDLPAPESCNAEASAAYADGLRLLRGGDDEQAALRFEDAASADAECAAAELRVAILGSSFAAPGRAREAFQQAARLRASLSERDQGLLDVYEPMLLRDPPDRRELSVRIEALADRFPMDAEIMALTASESRASPEARLPYARRAVEIDPRYSDGWRHLGRLLAAAGRDEEALAALETCTRVAPLSTDCLSERSEMSRHAGRCDDVEADARRIIARSSGTSLGYALLAGALAAQGSSAVAVGEVLEKRWQRLPKAGLEEERAADEVALAALSGAFDRAEARARELDRLTHSRTDIAERARSMRYLVESLVEAGKASEAARAAADFVQRRRAWERRVDASLGNLRGHFYDELALITLARDDGEIAEDHWRRERARFREAALISAKLDEQLIWTVSAAMPARTGAEAVEALAAYPSAAAVPGLSPSQIHPRFGRPGFPYIFTGRALLLAGRSSEAAASLRRGVAACATLDDPFLDTRAHLWLGQALEGVGDESAACEAYGVVLERWGRATPRSKTADEARRRAAQLACGPALKSSGGR